MCDIYSVDDDLARNQKKMMSFAATWVDTTLNSSSDREKDKCHVLSLTHGLKNSYK